ncbi:MAG TPA: c-type cytochrome [Longimicrobiales bacterium]
MRMHRGRMTRSGRAGRRGRGAGWLLLGAVLLLGACDDDDEVGPQNELPPLDPELVAEGREIFRYDTFGDESFWTDTLRLHEVVQTVDPTTALAVGLKVDASAVPPEVLANADLTDPATTVALLRLDAVVGVQAEVDDQGNITRLGITCALCHSTVDDAVADGIGNRLDGWPNRDLNVGAIVALSPALDSASKAKLNSWGPGYYDAYWNRDGESDPVVIPPAYGLRQVALETYTGEGPVSYWNAYVAVTQMHGQGSFADARLGIAIEREPDLVTPKLPALREYQFSLEAPPPPDGSFNAAAAARGQDIFNGVGQCATCHRPESQFTDAPTLHAAPETGMDGRRAARGTTGRYRTTPLRGLWQHPPYFHDGSAATLADVVAHYNDVLDLGLTEQQRADLVEYLKSL